MEKPNTKMKLIISFSLIGILILTAISSVAYSFFVGEYSVNEALNVNTAISNEGQPVFTSTVDGNLNLEITTGDLLNATDGSVIESANQTLYVNFVGGSEDVPMSCTYDIVWTDSETDENKYVPSTGVIDNNLKEYTLKIVDMNGNNVIGETQINNLTSGNAVATGRKISSFGTTTTQTYAITASIYKLDIEQSIWGKTFISTVSAENVECGPYQPDPTTLAIGDNLAETIVEKGTENTMADDSSWGIINENGYRYEGDDPGNFVCFGSEETTCPEDNLYRIIGAFETKYDADGDNVAESTGYLAKIQKYIMYDKGNYGTIYHNVYEGTTVNSHYPNSEIYPALNSTWYGSLDSIYQNQIANANWNLGAVQQDYIKLSAGDFYAQERGTTVNTGVTEYEKVFKIGMIYPSDYGYGVLASNCSRTTALYDYGTSNCYNFDWLYIVEDYQWTMTAHIDSSNSSVFGIRTFSNWGRLYSLNTPYTRSVRPTFYLHPDIKVTGGTGTYDDPYRISL